MTYTYGADPELFVWDTDNNKFVSVHGLLPGTKYEPHKVERGAVQVDGVAAEFNIDPAKTYLEFARNIRAVRRQMQEMVQREGGNHLILVAKPTATFSQKDWNLIPDENKVLGCDPDYCGRSGVANPRPNPGKRTFRTGGGHVHIGWGDGFNVEDVGHFNDCRLMAMNLYNLGMNKDQVWDSDNERRQLYGSAYSFRPKSFGMEYRYLSNAWVDNPEAMKYVFKVAKNVVEQMDAYFGKSELQKRMSFRIPKTLIDAYDAKEAARPRYGYRGTPWEYFMGSKSINLSDITKRLPENSDFYY